MSESLNAIDIAEKIRVITQLNFVENNYMVIQKQVALHFIARLQPQSSPAPCACLIMVEAGYQYLCALQWPQLLRQPLPG
jgi:hypothetical protein